MMEKTEEVAKQLMESFIQIRRRENRMGHRVGKHKPGEIMVLYAICQHVEQGEPGLMVSEISEKLNVTSPTITQHINRLEAQGLVERHADAADRRIVRIRLTEEGRNYIQAVNKKRLDMFIGLVEHLGVKESIRFAEVLCKASEYMFQQMQQREHQWEEENKR